MKKNRSVYHIYCCEHCEDFVLRKPRVRSYSFHHVGSDDLYSVFSMSLLLDHVLKTRILREEVF